VVVVVVVELLINTPWHDDMHDHQLTTKNQIFSNDRFPTC
jgi:hypothetical protein